MADNIIEDCNDVSHQFTSHGYRNGVVQPLLTDFYQVTMAYAYWKTGKTDDIAVFDLFFRKNPFNGAFTIFAGLEECLKYLIDFKFSDSDLDYLKTVLPDYVEPGFFDYLRSITTERVKLYAQSEGSVVFPRVPLLRIEGPLPVMQLLETTLLNLVNYASLVATNAARYRLAAGNNIQLLEFGVRRAQGPDGALSASHYTYIGGFNGTSNVLAGKIFGIAVRGTHAHSFISSYVSIDQLNQHNLKDSNTGKEVNFVNVCFRYRGELSSVLNISADEANDGEMTAFLAYAMSFPTKFIALIDTYDCLKSGLLNFCAVAMGLHELGYFAIGVRIDSGDLAYLSIESRRVFNIIDKKYNIPRFATLQIVASNDINEETIISLNEQGHQINSFGIGTHLVTCQRQPALGCVFKLVEINGEPRIKLSHDVEKVTLPGKKQAYRLYGIDGKALLDLLQKDGEKIPEVRKKVLCRHPFEESKRAYVSPAKVKCLFELYFNSGKICASVPSLRDIKNLVQEELNTLRLDHKRYLNPTPYKVSVTDDLYHFLHDLWLENAPIGELS